MTIINMHQAKTELSDLVARAEAGEEIVIARRNKPAVKLVPVEAPDKTEGGPRMPGALAHTVQGQPADFDPFEHAPDDYISKDDIAAYYRKYPHEWDEMQRMVGFAEDKQAEYYSGLRQAVEAGKEFMIMQHGKPVAKVTPDKGSKHVRGFGMLSHLPSVPDELFFDPIPEEELRAWEGEDSSDPGMAKP
jgi:prevent-host-death family protein